MDSNGITAQNSVLNMGCGRSPADTHHQDNKLLKRNKYTANKIKETVHVRYDERWEGRESLGFDHLQPKICTTTEHTNPSKRAAT